MTRRFCTSFASFIAIACFTACDSTPDSVDAPHWKVVYDGDYLQTTMKIPGALLSAWGTSDSDMWIVGGTQEATPASSPILMHWSGGKWTNYQISTLKGTFWWVSSGDSGTVWMAGTGGHVIHYDPAANSFKAFTMPSDAQLWGIVSFSANDAWAVGGDAINCGNNATCGAIWHFDGTSWGAPTNLPSGWDKNAWFKVFGRGPKDLFICGLNGHILHWNGSVWTDEAVSTGKLLTGSCNGKLCVVVGGDVKGSIFEHDGTSWSNKTPASGVDGLNGVFVNSDGSAIAVGYANLSHGIWLRGTDGIWSADSDAPEVTQPYHAVFVDTEGGAWAVGGNIVGQPFSSAQLIHRGTNLIAKPVPSVP